MKYITTPQPNIKTVRARISFTPNQGPKETRKFLKQLNLRWPNINYGVHMPPKYKATWTGGGYGLGQCIYSGPTYPTCTVRLFQSAWDAGTNADYFSDINEFINDIADVLNREGVNEIELDNHSFTVYKF